MSRTNSSNRVSSHSTPPWVTQFLVGSRGQSFEGCKWITRMNLINWITICDRLHFGSSRTGSCNDRLLISVGKRLPTALRVFFRGYNPRDRLLFLSLLSHTLLLLFYEMLESNYQLKGWLLNCECVCVGHSIHWHCSLFTLSHSLVRIPSFHKNIHAHSSTPLPLLRLLLFLFASGANQTKQSSRPSLETLFFGKKEQRFH